MVIKPQGIDSYVGNPPHNSTYERNNSKKRSLPEVKKDENKDSKHIIDIRI